MISYATKGDWPLSLEAVQVTRLSVCRITFVAGSRVLRPIIRMIVVSLTFLLLGFSKGEAAGWCSGTACDAVRLSVKGECHTVTNVGSRVITVQWGIFGPFSLRPGQSNTITFNGKCVGTIVGDFTANY